MKPHIVVDVGNSRIKWGLCDREAIAALASLPPKESETWQRQLDSWKLATPLNWAISGVHPLWRDELADWARRRGDSVIIVEDWRPLPMKVKLAHPERVGIDRLLDGVAAKNQALKRKDSLPAVIVDAGSAVTVDWLDEEGSFCGGAIFPGLRLMAKALRDYTALLPSIEVQEPLPPLPATSTASAMEAGILWAVVGGIQVLTQRLAAASGTATTRYLTGGDALLLQSALGPAFHVWPEMTLEGLRVAAENYP
jgi:type III pantothenate kinase